jgi:hypothetical protein
VPNFVPSLLNKLDKVRRMLGAVTDRFAQFEAQALALHVDFPLFQRLALPIPRAPPKSPASNSTTPASSA